MLAVRTVSEWKEALDGAGTRPVVALFSSAADVGCRLLGPVFARLPDAEEGAFQDHTWCTPTPCTLH